MKIAIYGGTFDPIHNGHVMMANYVAHSGLLDEVWILVSPQNPLKRDARISDDATRLEMARIATRGLDRVRVSDFEMSLPRPSYTALTLQKLSESYPQHDFSLIIGSDNWLTFDRWRSPVEIASRHPIIVYPRPGYDARYHMPRILTEAGIATVSYLADAPVAEISSTFIRTRLSQGADMRGFIPESVARYITSHHLYEPIERK